MVDKQTLCNFEVHVDEQNKTADVKFYKTSRPVMPWRDELLNAARHIRNSTDRPLYLCLSGGIDSEVMARAFVEAGIKFEALTMRHMQYTNDHEVAYATEFCRKYNIKLHYLPIDLTEFFVNIIPDYIAKGYNGGVTTFSVYTYLYMIEAIYKMGGSAVIGMGEPVLRNIEGNVFMEFILYRYNTYKFLMDNPEHTHFPWFFLQTPELLAAYFNEPLVKLLTSDPSYYEAKFPIWLQSLEKSIVYHKHFPEMRRRGKGTGWERFRNAVPNLQIWINERREEFKDLMIDKKYWMNVDGVKGQLGVPKN